MSPTPTALVVDDADDIRMLVRHVLTGAGLGVVEAATGTEALDLLARERDFDVVVLDVQMPDLDGWDTLASIRGGIAPEVAVIVCSVKASTDDMRRGWLLGCDGYLAKPFDITELVEEVNAVLARTPAEREIVRTRRIAGEC